MVLAEACRVQRVGIAAVADPVGAGNEVLVANMLGRLKAVNAEDRRVVVLAVQAAVCLFVVEHTSADSLWRRRAGHCGHVLHDWAAPQEAHALPQPRRRKEQAQQHGRIQVLGGVERTCKLGLRVCGVLGRGFCVNAADDA